MESDWVMFKASSTEVSVCSCGCKVISACHDDVWLVKEVLVHLFNVPGKAYARDLLLHQSTLPLQECPMGRHNLES